MRLFLNEPSLVGMSGLDQVANYFTELMSARARSPNLRRVLFCSRKTAETEALNGERLLNTVARMPRDKRGAILSWLGKSGPFMDDDREEIDEDLYHLGEMEVTDLGPGEATRQTQRGFDARLLSFANAEGQSLFAYTPVHVVQGFPDEPVDSADIRNTWDLTEARQWADAIDPEPESWRELLDVCRRRYGSLAIGEHCDHILGAQTFYPAVSRRIIELLRILNEVTEDAASQAGLGARGMDLVQTHFAGGKPWFTDESDDNKTKFAREMIFPDPIDPSQRIQCFWHGKIKTPQFRIHFEWPLPATATRMKVAYIGPKISKK